MIQKLSSSSFASRQSARRPTIKPVTFAAQKREPHGPRKEQEVSTLRKVADQIGIAFLGINAGIILGIQLFGLNFPQSPHYQPKPVQHQTAGNAADPLSAPITNQD